MTVQGTIVWGARVSPLPPAGVAAEGEAALRLARHLLRDGASDQRLALLKGVCAPRLILLLGAADDLPWVPGAQYLGRDVAAPRLLVPTVLEPNLPIDLLASALQRAHHSGALALLPALPCVVPLEDARTVSAERLREWLQQQGGAGA